LLVAIAAGMTVVLIAAGMIGAWVLWVAFTL
jgi:hypothetical protein